MPKARRAKKVEARRKREFTLRGKTLPELQAMSLEDLTKVLTARARRSIRRGFNSETTLFFEAMRTSAPGKTVRTHCRDALVLPEHVGRHVAIHNGKEFFFLMIRPPPRSPLFPYTTLTRRFEKHS